MRAYVCFLRSASDVRVLTIWRWNWPKMLIILSSYYFSVCYFLPTSFFFMSIDHAFEKKTNFLNINIKSSFTVVLHFLLFFFKVTRKTIFYVKFTLICLKRFVWNFFLFFFFLTQKQELSLWKLLTFKFLAC